MSELVVTRYRREIDGLRALAVLAVLFFHAGAAVPGGYIGVDVFFVISGFLITGIILRSLDAERFSLVEFWERRVRRIFPALFVMVVVVCAIGYDLLLPDELVGLGKSAVAQGLVLANVHFWRDTGYFANAAESKPLLHTWSLALEEQFYFFFPLLLVAMRKMRRQRQFLTLSVLCAFSFAGSVYGSFFHRSAAFYLPPTRAWELLAGSILAVAPWKCSPNPFRDTVVGAAGLAAILVPAFLYDHSTRFPGMAAVPPVLGTAAVLLATEATPNSAICRFLSLRALSSVGLISYSLYLWHWPAIVYARMYVDSVSAWSMLLAVASAVAVAVISWRFIEQPFRHSRTRGASRKWFAAALVLNAAVLCVGIVFVRGNGLPLRFPRYCPILLEDTTWAGYEFAVSVGDRIDARELPNLGVDGKPGDKLDLVLWGDSHGMCIAHVAKEAALELKLSARAILAPGAPPLPNAYCPMYQDRLDADRRNIAIMQYLAENPPRNLLLVGRWSLYAGGPSSVDGTMHPGYLASDVARDVETSESPPEVLRRNLSVIATFCKKHGISLWIMKQVPETGEAAAARELFLWSIGRRTECSDHRRSIVEHRMRQAKAEEIFREFSTSSVSFIDPTPFLLGTDESTINYVEGRACYRDESHLSRWGARLLCSVIRDVLSKMKNGESARQAQAALSVEDR